MHFLTMWTLLISFSTFADESLQDIQKKHRTERHEEKKKWNAMEDDCKAKYPKKFDSKSDDYDKFFKCTEAIKDAENIFETKQREELCSKLSINCKK